MHPPNHLKRGRVALEAICGELTLAELASKYGVHQTMIAQWKHQAIEGMAGIFSGKSRQQRRPVRKSGTMFVWNIDVIYLLEVYIKDGYVMIYLVKFQ